MPSALSPTPKPDYYDQGYDAFLRGSKSVCPASVPNKGRRLWYDGYYAAHVEYYVGSVLRKWGLSDDQK